MGWRARCLGLEVSGLQASVERFRGLGLEWGGFETQGLGVCSGTSLAYDFDTETSKPGKTEGGNPLGYVPSVRKIRGLVNCRLVVLQGTYSLHQNLEASSEYS